MMRANLSAIHNVYNPSFFDNICNPKALPGQHSGGASTTPLQADVENRPPLPSPSHPQAELLLRRAVDGDADAVVPRVDGVLRHAEAHLHRAPSLTGTGASSTSSGCFQCVAGASGAVLSTTPSPKSTSK